MRKIIKNISTMDKLTMEDKQFETDVPRKKLQFIRGYAALTSFMREWDMTVGDMADMCTSISKSDEFCQDTKHLNTLMLYPQAQLIPLHYTDASTNSDKWEEAGLDDVYCCSGHGCSKALRRGPNQVWEEDDIRSEKNVLNSSPSYFGFTTPLTAYPAYRTVNFKIDKYDNTVLKLYCSPECHSTSFDVWMSGWVLASCGLINPTFVDRSCGDNYIMLSRNKKHFISKKVEIDDIYKIKATPQYRSFTAQPFTMTIQEWKILYEMMVSYYQPDKLLKFSERDFPTFIQAYDVLHKYIREDL
jgi:hypothetical protein